MHKPTLRIALAAACFLALAGCVDGYLVAPAGPAGQVWVSSGYDYAYPIGYWQCGGWGYGCAEGYWPNSVVIYGPARYDHHGWHGDHHDHHDHGHAWGGGQHWQPAHPPTAHGWSEPLRTPAGGHFTTSHSHRQ